MAKEECCAGGENIMILACSGGSNVGQLSNQAAVELTQEGSQNRTIARRYLSVGKRCICNGGH